MPPPADDDAPSAGPSAFGASTPPPPPPPPPTRAARAAGLACIAAVATIWAGASFVVAAAEGQGLAPLALTYIANSTFILYVPLYCVLRARQKRLAPKSSELRPPGAPPSSAAAAAAAAAVEEAEGAALVPSPRTSTPSLRTSLTPTPHELAIARAAAVVAPLWFGAQLAFNVSLTATSVTSNTVLSSTSAALTYVASVAVLKERPTARKAVCVGVALAGVAAVAVADGATRGGRGGKSSLGGDALTLLAAGLYAAYTITLRRMLGDEGGAGTMLFFGCIGAINLVAGAPIVAIAALATHAHLPPRRLIGVALAKGLLDNALSDYLWARAVLLVGPTVASVGLNAQVPLAAGLDAAFGSPRPPWTASAGAAAATAVGAALVVGGVVGIATAEEGGGVA